MKRHIAFVLAVFTLLLSTESSLTLHFCHDQLVATSVNKELTTCCAKKQHDRPMFSGICCELSSFDTQLHDAVIDDTPYSFEIPVTAILFVPSFATFIVEGNHEQLRIPRPPPKPFSQDFHVLFEQFLI